ncbi:LysR family transcriptional regulator [Acidocella sp.]|uniref:LysR family transcriptional regulator n=1 Tax=Acidocella sp. TaxID=50710 RepID=UPI00261ADB06|nr:LysR family transcriptional regulator [Acidocella sp.]
MPQALSSDWFLRSRLKLRHLQLIMAIDEHRNLHRAAERMNIAQPAASKLLAEVEAIFGQALFERHPRGLLPTVQGEILIRNGAVAMRTLAQAASEVNAYTKGQTGMVTVGTVVAPMMEFLLDVIETVRTQHPHLHITVEHSISDILAPKVLEGKLDFALGRIPARLDPKEFSYRELWGEELHFLCRDTHPLAEQSQVTLQDMAKWPWVLQPRGAPLRHRIEQMFLTACVPMPKSIVNTASALMSLISVSRSDCLTALEWNVAKLMADTNRIKILPFPERIFLQPFGILTMAGRPLSPGAKIMYDAVTRAAAGMIEQKNVPGLGR